jgi:glycosyltransferase involved in cell wall biosynthesis
MATGIYTQGGGSIVVENLSNQLRKMGFQVTIGAYVFKEAPARGLYEISTIPLRKPQSLRKFLGDFDIIHCHHPLGNYLSYFSNVPFIYHYHGAPDTLRSIGFRLSAVLSLEVTHYHIDAVVAVSSIAFSQVRPFFDSEQAYIVENGVNTEVFRPGIQGIFRQGEPQFLFVGNLYHHKNVKELVIGLKELLTSYPDAHLQVIGDGPDSRKLKRLIFELGLDAHVSMLGYVPNNRLPTYYSSCDVYLSSSESETFDLPLLEALACGKPVVASSIPAHIKLVSGSKAGIIYKIGDVADLAKCMTYAFENRASYSDAAWGFACKKDWRIIAQKIIHIYKEVSLQTSRAQSSFIL